MRKTKYYYNKETCSYEVVKLSRKEMLFKYLRFLIIVIISSFMIISLYDKYFESPVIISLKKENQELKTHFDERFEHTYHGGLLTSKDISATSVGPLIIPSLISKIFY